MAYGRTPLTTSTVLATRLSTDGSPEYKTGGVTIDWSTVAAVSGTDATLADGSVVKVGTKYLRYGQTLAKITASGKFGPYDPAASDGRQTLARGDAFLMDETVLEYGGTGSQTGAVHDHQGVIDGGSVWAARLLNAGTGTASLAAGPTLANLLAAFPRIRPVKN